MFRAVSLFAALVVCCAALVSPGEADLQEKATNSQVEAVGVPFHWVGMTTPPPGTAPSSIVETIVYNIDAQLHSKHGQWANALVATIMGTCLIVNGDAGFKWLVIAAVFLFTMLAALSDITQIWGLGYDSVLRRIVSLEVGAVSAYAAYRGIGGVILAVGAVVGAIFANATQQTLVHFGASFSENHIFIAVWYSIIILGLMVVLERRKHLAAMAFISPFIGGALVSSAFFWFLANCAKHGALHVTGSVSGAWVDFLEHIIKQDNYDVGIFAGKDPVQLLGHSADLDVIYGRAFWFLLFVFGVFFQINTLKKAKESQKVAAKEKSLHQPLMRDSV